jgi:hypothetical protein
VPPFDLLVGGQREIGLYEQGNDMFLIQTKESRKENKERENPDRIFKKKKAPATDESVTGANQNYWFKLFLRLCRQSWKSRG